MSVEYKDDDVLTAAKKRIAYIFDEFENIITSISSGKDSTCLYYLVLEEAIKRDRKVHILFLDQEAEYQSSINLIEKMMQHPNIIPLWFQIPLHMTNATSHDEYFLHAWGPGETWLREKHPMAIHSVEGRKSDRFYAFFDWFEQTHQTKTALLVGLRSKESLNRFRSVTKNPGYKDCAWSSKTKNENCFRFYPIYDWCFPDVWKFIWDNKIEYNKIYDMMFIKQGDNISKMRVSVLIHEKSFRALADLQEFEPETYEKLLKRLKGVHCAAMYAREDYIFKANKLPEVFGSWKEYRDYLLNTTPIDKKERFTSRFEKQEQTESVYQQQCKQILINDWENNLPVNQNKNWEKIKEKWMKIL